MQNIVTYEVTNQTAAFFLSQGKQCIYPLTLVWKKSKTFSQLKLTKNKSTSPSRQEIPSVEKKKKKTEK